MTKVSFYVLLNLFIFLEVSHQILADLLFESDIGFWQSLSNVAKKARCPIILTAPNPPHQLLNSIQYRYGYLSKPSPSECASKMCQIAKMENMTWNNTYGTDIKNGLASIAKMCNCDLRRIMNEMQLFNHGSGFKKEQPIIEEKHQLLLDTSDRFEIESVSPKQVSFNSQSMLTIRLSKSLENVSSLSVIIGDQLSPKTKLVSPKTIQTICPPCNIPDHVDEFGLIKKIHDRSLDTMYKHLVIEVTFNCGKKYRSDICPRADYPPPVINYEFPEESFICKTESNRQSEKDDTTNFENSWMNEVDDHVNTDLCVSSSSATAASDNEMKELSRMLENVTKASEAAFLNSDLQQLYQPHLTGAVVGCHDSTEIQSGNKYNGGSDVFMTRPTSHRDRSLHSKTCTFSRGLASFDPDITNYIPSSDLYEPNGEDDSCIFDSTHASSISDEDMFLPHLSSLGAQAAAYIRHSLAGAPELKSSLLHQHTAMEKDTCIIVEKLMHIMTREMYFDNKLL